MLRELHIFPFFFFKHAYTSLHQSFSLSLSWRAYPAPQHLLTSSGAVLPWAFTALSSTCCQHLQHKLVHSEYSLCPVPCHHSHRKVWQATSTSAFEFGAAVRFWSQPLKCPTYCALLCIMEQSPSAQTRFLSDKTKLEEVPRQHRQHRQSTPAARSMQSRGPHQSCSSSGPLLVATCTCLWRNRPGESDIHSPSEKLNKPFLLSMYNHPKLTLLPLHPPQKATCCLSFQIFTQPAPPHSSRL